MKDGIEATPPNYFQLKTGFTKGESRESVFHEFRRTPPEELTPQLIAAVIECMKLSVMFVADWEYHARTGFDKRDALAFIVSMETTGQPPASYPKGLQ